MAAIAAALTVLHEQGLSFAVGAVSAWLLYVFFLALAGGHDWAACSYCETPPRAEATPEARAKMARRHHRKVEQRVVWTLLMAVLAHAVLPKPYMSPWWAKLIAASVYFLIAVRFGYISVRMDRHRLYHSECHVDWCREGLRRSPGLPRLRRRRMWRGHYGVWGMAVLAPSACALSLFEAAHHSIYLRIGYGLALFVLLRIVLAIGVHVSEPCIYCAKNLPDRPEEVAERRMRWLKLFHRTRLGVLTGAGISWVVSWVLAGSVAAKVLVCAAALALVFWAVLERVHSPLKPWCPWCRDGGGEDADTEVPDPSANIPAPTG